MNNNLIIFYKDKSKDVFSFSLDVTEAEALKQFEVMRPSVKNEDVHKYFFMLQDEVPIDTYGNFAELTEEDEITINSRAFLCQTKAEEVRKKRDILLSKLDIPFLRSLEDEDKQVQNHIKLMKNFLRDLPHNLRFDKLKSSAIPLYNPFGNIFEIILVDGGSGYEKPPKVTIDNARFEGVGFPAECVAFINEGKVIKIELTNYGCGYDFIPKVTIDTPEGGKAAMAFAGAPQNTHLNIEDLKSNTRKHYLPSP